LTAIKKGGTLENLKARSLDLAFLFYRLFHTSFFRVDLLGFVFRKIFQKPITIMVQQRNQPLLVSWIARRYLVNQRYGLRVLADGYLWRDYDYPDSSITPICDLLKIGVVTL